MCENRERLIGYVYGECEPDERQLIEEHLASCHVCRREIRGLRSVRQDLLAWEVPDSDAVWRPVAPARVKSPWQSLPAWAMTAAAAAVLMIGAAGGAASHALLSREAPVAAQAAAVSPVREASNQPAADIARVDVARLEARLVERMRAELDTRIRVSAGGVQTAAPSGPAMTPAAVNDLARRVNTLTARQDELYDLLLVAGNQTDAMRGKLTGLEQSSRMLVSYIEGQGSDGFGGR